MPSPTLFLSAIRRCLSDGGRLALVQPTADVASYDILFVDHLHHFAGPHLAAYARKCGFEQVFTEVGHPLMPNFSLHIWEARAESSLSIPNAAPTQCREAAVAAIDAMARLDRLLARLAAEGRRVAVFGVHEVHALARAYSGLDTFPIVCGLDDEPERAGTRDLLFPVVRPEEARRFAVTDALFTMNANYYPTAARRCESLGLVWHGLF